MKKIIIFLFMMIFSSLAMASHVTIGNWVVFEKQDEITDKKTILIATPELSNMGKTGLALNCLSIEILFSDNRMKPRYGQVDFVIMRVDKNEPHYVNFESHYEGYRYYPSPDILNEMKSGNKLVVRFENWVGTNTFSYSLKGFTQAYNQLRKICYK